MNIEIAGRRWFNKTCGNTYHTATVEIDGKPVFASGVEYGYGDHYTTTAFDWLEESGLIPERNTSPSGSREPIWVWSERNDITVHEYVLDVARKKDL
jgi:hypothetical protein